MGWRAGALGRLGEGYRPTRCKRVVSEEGNLGGREAGGGGGVEDREEGEGWGTLSFSLQ